MWPANARTWFMQKLTLYASNANFLSIAVMVSEKLAFTS